ncbi:Retrovirus-related Pol polyprotein from transposon RE2 [Vitis vinifera]|uniref:Retrovirus-related Pol polyprotein from transposon RE2 n=1 Tax=Vitis vinifera TaxID=29760 RepID=A0A438IRK4_VITVI|nr:Retrovirus-related Pol polyprotein from transposon RE2 [Vitis vinifera]
MAGDDAQKLVEHGKHSNPSRTTEPWENSNHPLFLHHSDQPGVVLVSQPLMEDNYTTWVQSMDMALTVKNKKGFVDGTLNRPTHNPNEQQQWDRCNILERFSHTNTVQLFNIENAIHECAQGTAAEVKTYMETQKTMKFLMGLGDNYATVRSNIIGMDPLPTVNKAYAMALRHEKQAEASNGKVAVPNEASAFSVRKLDQDPNTTEREVKCHTYDYCRRRKNTMGGGQGRSKVNHAATLNEGKEDVTNFPLSQSECQQMMGLLSKIKTAATSHSDGHQMLEMLHATKQASANLVGNVPNYEELSGRVFALSRDIKDTMWILDSGASDHIVCDSSFLTSFQPVHNRIVKLPDGTSAHVSHIGTDLQSGKMIGMGTESEGLYCLNLPRKGTCNVVNTKTQDLHLLNVARALLFQSHLPKPFWGDAILTAAYLINRTPTPLLQGKTPFEKLFHKSPNYSHLRVFGCRCFVSTHPLRPSKFDPRSIESVFIGYPHGQKGYKVYSLKDKKVLISRDVTFFETEFPYQNGLSTTSPSLDTFFPSLPQTPDMMMITSLLSLGSTVQSSFTKHVTTCHLAAFTITARRSSRPTKTPTTLQDFHIEAALPSRPFLHLPRARLLIQIKYNPDGTIERYKARLVAKGFSQVEGIDYRETFAPVAKLTTVRVLLSLASIQGWHLHQLDVNNAFLNGDLYEDVVHAVASWFRTKGEHRVCKLHKSLYGLKQASRQWFLKLSSALKAAGFKQSWSDYSLFVRNTQAKVLSWHRSGKVQADGIVLCQRKYALEVLEDAGFLGAKPSRFPVEQSLTLTRGDGAELKDASQYRRLVGRLIYLTITRPDLIYAVHILSQFMDTPRQPHLDAAYKTGLVAKTPRRSTTGYCIFFGNAPISWKTKKQGTVSRSSAEAEYRSMATTCCEITWLRSLLADLNVNHAHAVKLFCDNQAAIHIASNPVFHERTKHIEMDCHVVREKVQRGLVKTMHIRTQEQPADLFTKPLSSKQFSTLLSKLGVINIHTNLRGVLRNEIPYN